MNFNDALQEARRVKPEVNCWAEYPLCFVFGLNRDTERIKGGERPLVVLKDGSGCIDMLDAVFGENECFGGEVIAEGRI